MVKRIFVVLLTIVLLPYSTFAQEKGTQSENPGKEKEEQKVKFVLSGQIRPRIEIDDRSLKPDTPSEFFVTSRFRLGLKALIEDNMEAVIQIQDVRFWGEESHPLFDFSGDNIDFHQAYFAYKWKGDIPTDLKVGRQEIAVDEQRLVGSVDWTQQAQSFDAFLVNIHPQLWQGMASWARIRDASAQGLVPKFTADVDSDLFVLYFASKHLENHKLNGQMIILNDQINGTLATYGAYFNGRQNNIDYRFEGYLQRGEAIQQTQDVSAYMWGAQAGYSFADVQTKPSVRVWYDYLSGDDDLEDDEFKVFNTLFATNHKFYGLMDFFLNIPVHTGQRGLQDFAIKFALTPFEKSRLFFDFHNFRLAQQNDFGDKSLGQEFDIWMRYPFNKYMTLLAGYGFFSTGDAMVPLRGPENGNWGFFQLDFKF